MTTLLRALELLQDAVAELRRQNCRSLKDCEHCRVVKEIDAWLAEHAIVQTPDSAAAVAEAGAARLGEKHD